MGNSHVIIGGGVIGLSIAMYLALEGDSVTVLEAKTCGSGASGAAAGMLAPFAEVEHEGPFLNLCRSSLEMYDDFLKLVNRYSGSVPIGAPNGLLRVACSDTEASLLEKQYQWQVSNGISSELLSPTQIRSKYEPNISPNIQCGLFSLEERQVDPQQLVKALRSVAIQFPIKVLENVKITDIVANNGLEINVQIENGRSQIMSFDTLTIASGAWSAQVAEIFGFSLPIKPIKGQIVSLKPATPLINHVVFGKDCYLVPRQDGRVIVGATVEDVGFDETVSDSSNDALLDLASRFLCGITKSDMIDSWTGLRPASADGLPLLGLLPGLSNVFVATGHYRNGILLAPITGKLIRDAILQRPNDSVLLQFSPARFI